MRATPWTFPLAYCFTLIAFAQSTAPAITATTVPTSRPADQIPRATLVQMYQSELADKFDPAMADQLVRAHELIERYFAEPDARKETVAELEKTGIDPNVLGRLVRIRMGWPDMKAGVYYINEKFGPYRVRYFLGLPKDYERTVAWPLVVKLPAADAFVREPRPSADQVTAMYHRWMEEEIAAHPDAICLMPLLNLDELYGPSYAGMHTVIQPMHHAFDRANIDPARVYVIGHSMSAHAVWNLALHYTTYFAAINPLAGGASAEFQRVRMMNLRNVYPVVWHDAADRVIKVDGSRQLTRILRTMKIDFDYNETKDVGHTPTPQVAQDRYAKLRSRTRDLYPGRVSLQSNRPDTIFNRNDWLQLYQPMRPGDEQWLIFRRGYGHMVVYSNTFRADATWGKGNRIDATTDNVGLMRFYLNDLMVDFAQPVTVVVNRRGVFEAMLKPSVDEMLKDQLILGRGWRYFTAVVDVDLMPKPVTRPSTTQSSSTTRGSR